MNSVLISRISKIAQNEHIPAVLSKTSIGPFKLFLLESGVTYQHAKMATKHLFPDGLVCKDVEKFKQRNPPPLSFIPTPREESTGNLTTVTKVKISKILTEAVTAFVGTYPESHVELMDTIFGISCKMDLEAKYKVGPKEA